MKDMQSSAGCGHSADVPARSPFSLMQGSARTAALKEQMRIPEEGAVIRNVLLARGYMQPVEGETAMPRIVSFLARREGGKEKRVGRRVVAAVGCVVM